LIANQPQRVYTYREEIASPDSSEEFRVQDGSPLLPNSRNQPIPYPTHRHNNTAASNIQEQQSEPSAHEIANEEVDLIQQRFAPPPSANLRSPSYTPPEEAENGGAAQSAPILSPNSTDLLQST